MSIRGIARYATAKGIATPTNAPIYVDSDDNKLKLIPAGSGSVELEVPAQAAFATLAADGAIPVTNGTSYLTKTSAGAYTVAAPGAGGIGTILVLTTGTDFAHVVTFTGSTLRDGTTGAKVTWTAAAFAGSSITVEAVSATVWNVISKNLGTVA